MKKLIFLLIAVIALSNCSAQTTNNKLNIEKEKRLRIIENLILKNIEK